MILNLLYTLVRFVLDLLLARGRQSPIFESRSCTAAGSGGSGRPDRLHGEEVDRESRGTPELHPLATLHRLDIADKHKVLTVTTGVIGGDSISGLPFESSVESAGWLEWTDGAQLGRIRLPSASQQLPVGSYVPYFNVVLLEPPLQSADVIWVAEAVLVDSIQRYVIEPLHPFARP
jgi:hypothetical protein